GNFVKAGGNWSGQYTLDLEKPEVLDYIKKCLNWYMELGFDFFKLDFLYAPGLDVPEGYSRCQWQEKSYRFLKETLKGKTILGCGATLVNCIDNFDYLRIGPDVSLEWDDVFYMRLFHRERPSSKVTLQNTIFRSILNDRWFGNDPDVFLLRDNNVKMNADQKKSLAVINSLFSSVLMTSDDIGTYDEEKEKQLQGVLDNFLHAKNAGFAKKDGKIHIFYELNNQKFQYVYDYKKGVLTNG
ncbi:MAG: alpha-galactosidase, partial [Bacilli bacterium]|nr:alpha-galactosidase [Bacilli bacterium]